MSANYYTLRELYNIPYSWQNEGTPDTAHASRPTEVRESYVSSLPAPSTNVIPPTYGPPSSIAGGGDTRPLNENERTAHRVSELYAQR